MFGRLAESNAMAQILYGLALRFAFTSVPRGILDERLTLPPVDMAGAQRPTPRLESLICHKQRQILRPSNHKLCSPV